MPQPCLFGHVCWPGPGFFLFAVSGMYGHDYSFSGPRSLRGKRDAFVRVSDKREAYAVWVRLREHDQRTG